MRHILVLIKNIFACIKCFLRSSQRIVSPFTYLLCSGRGVNYKHAAGDALNRYRKQIFMHAECSSPVLETCTHSFCVFFGMNESQANILLFPIKLNMDLSHYYLKGTLGQLNAVQLIQQSVYTYNSRDTFESEFQIYKWCNQHLIDNIQLHDHVDYKLQNMCFYLCSFVCN